MKCVCVCEDLQGALDNSIQWTSWKQPDTLFRFQEHSHIKHVCQGEIVTFWTQTNPTLASGDTKQPQTFFPRFSFLESLS